MPIYQNGFNNQNLGYNTQTMPQQNMNYQYIPQQQATNSFAWVSGKAGAEAYPVAPGNTVMLMDENDMKLYIKTIDINGRPEQLKVYALVEEQPNQNEQIIDTSSFITRDEIDNIIEEKLKRLNRNKNNKKKGDVNNG